MARHLLLAAPQMSALATRVAEVDPRIQVGKVSWDRFPDTFPNIFLHDVDAVRAAHVTVLLCFDAPDRIFEQMSFLLQLAQLRPRSLKVLLPYFPTGTMERIDHEGQVATAATLARMFGILPLAGPGPIPFYVWDIHALPIRHYFPDNVSFVGKSGIKYLKRKLEGNAVSIAFPDAGAHKRFKVMFEEKESDGSAKYPFIVCSKERKGDERRVVIAEGEVAGKDVVIVDDLVHSGGTILECFKALKAAGARTVSAYVTHGVMENGAWERFRDAGFHRVYLTDSCPGTAETVDGIDPFRVITLAASIANAVMEGHGD